MKRLILFISLSLFFHGTYLIVPTQLVQYQEPGKKWENNTYKNGIKTVLIHKQGWELSFPIINLNNEDEKISLSFDELGDDTNDYSWQIIHCNMDWTQSELEPIEYLSGFFEGDIQDYSLSKNTTVNYIHYHISFPNNDVTFQISGNYIVNVFEQNDPSQIVLTRRFYIVDKKVDVHGSVFKQPLGINTNNQRINFSVGYNNEITDPHSNLISTVIKNNESTISTKDIFPSKTGISKIGFENIKELSFAGGNEFRHFDIKSIKFVSDKINKIEYSGSFHKIILRPETPEIRNNYTFKNDLNGKKLIKLENSNKSNIEADYCQVVFYLNTPLNLNIGDYYVYGALSDWELSDNNKMTFDNTKQCYTLTLFLKQGYYNYQYIFKSEGLVIDKANQWFSVEGNYYQTENDYHILTYYKNPSATSEELVGFVKINTDLNK